MLVRTLILAGGTALVLTATNAPARADWHHEGGWGWHGHGDWHHPWGGPGFYRPWVYAPPPPVYYAPPPPAYYGPPPGMSFSFGWP